MTVNTKHNTTNANCSTYRCVTELADRITASVRKLNLVHFRTFIYIYHIIALNMPTYLQTTRKVTLPFYRKPSDLLTRNEGSQSSPACSSGQGKQVHEVEGWWNYINRGKQNYSNSNLSQ
jgi:hypothetical protein